MAQDTTHRPPGASPEPPDGSRRSWRGQAIPIRLRRRLEALLDCDLSRVRLHTEPSLARLGALACACGEHIHLSPGAPRLDTPAGVAMLAHELAHVLQQRAGRVRIADGTPVVADGDLEAEADRAAAHCAARLFPGSLADPGLPPALRRAPAGGAAAGTAQRPIQFMIDRRRRRASAGAAHMAEEPDGTELVLKPLESIASRIRS